MSERMVSEVQRAAQAALASNPVQALRELTVEALDDSLLISGTVTSFYHKQLAQEIVRAFDESVVLVNSVQVAEIHGHE